MTIGQVAKAAGVSPSTIRYYEAAGILSPPRRKNGIRDYDDSAIARLRVLRFYRASGVSIENIASMYRHDGAEPSTDWQTVTQRRIVELDAVIAEAQSAKVRLQDLLECECRGETQRCVIFT